MSELSRIERILIFCQCRFGGEKGVGDFVHRFNLFFGREFSRQTILFEMAKCLRGDPANNAPEADEAYGGLWREYADAGRLAELKRFFRMFRREDFTAALPGEFEVARGGGAPGGMVSASPSPVVDIPREVPVSVVRDGVLHFPRDPKVAWNALAAAGFVCEAACGTALFTRKGADVAYTEAHHLMPLSCQRRFDHSLDVEANVVSLCPMCHRRLHQGRGNEDRLRRLYEARIGRLRKCGVDFPYEELLLVYR